MAKLGYLERHRSGLSSGAWQSGFPKWVWSYQPGKYADLLMSDASGKPTDDFINKAMDCKGITGEVTHVFPPGYEVTAQFPVGEGAQAFHMKDNWIERIKLTPEQAARIKLFAESYGEEWKDELLGFWLTGKDAQLKDGHLLRQVRNQFGPRWLMAVDLKDL